MVDLSGEECDADKRRDKDPLRWLLIQAEEHLEAGAIRNAVRGQTVRSHRVQPTRLVAFSAWPGEGCKGFNIGLGKFPAVVTTLEGPIKTQLPGWRWSSFCNSQYASDPSCGGVPNFLQCHLTIIAMLDRAKELGCLAEVTDEGGFYKKRDLQALVQEVGSWNETLAVFGGKLKDLAGARLQAPITNYPNFERLEAAGQDKLPPGYQQLLKLIQRVGRRAGR